MGTLSAFEFDFESALSWGGSERECNFQFELKLEFGLVGVGFGV